MKASPLKERTTKILFLSGILSGGTAIILVRQPWATEPQWDALWLLLVLGAFLCAAAFLRIEKIQGDPNGIDPVANPGPERRRIWKWIGGAYIFCGVILTGFVVWQVWARYPNAQGAFVPWCFSIGMVLVGAAVLRFAPVKGAAPEAGPVLDPAGVLSALSIPKWLEWAFFGGILLLAIFLRLYRLDTIPPGIWSDETNSAVNAMYILGGQTVSPFSIGWGGVPNAYMFYMAGIFHLFGASYFTLKLASIIPAVLTVAAIYPLGRLLFGPLGGISAMAFLATFRWHLTMSRWGWYETTTPLFEILAVYFLIRGLTRRKPLDFALGGVISGLMMYTYISSRLVLMFLAVFAIYWMLVDKRGVWKSLATHFPGLLIFLIAALIPFAPLAVSYVKDPTGFGGRMGEVSIFKDIQEDNSLQPLMLNISDHARFFFQEGDRNGRHNVPGEPMVDPISGFLMVTGLAYGVLRLRDWRRGLLWLWLLSGLAGGIFSSRYESPQAYRTMIIVPAIALICGDVLALSARAMWRWISAWKAYQGLSPSWYTGKLVPILLVALPIAGSSGWSSWVFFGNQASSAAVATVFNVVETNMSKDIITGLESGKDIYTGPHIYDSSIVRYMIGGWVMQKTHKINMDTPPFDYVRPEIDLPLPDHGHDAIIYLNTWYWGVRDYITAIYPDAEIVMVQDVQGGDDYVRVAVPEEDLAAYQGINVRYTFTDGSIENRPVATVNLTPVLDEVTSVRWQGYLRIHKSGNYNFGLDNGQTLWIDGEKWADGRHLMSGLHGFKLEQSGMSGKPSLTWTLPDSQPAPIPSEFFFQMSIPKQGLTGYFYPNADWSGSPFAIQQAPFVMTSWPDYEPIEGSFSVKYKGSLLVSTPGRYHFRIYADDGARLILDGKVLGEGMLPGQSNEFQFDVDLSAGKHPVELDYFQAGGGSDIGFFWEMPGKGESIVPPSALIPDGE